jgi:hypothetical protein
MGFSLACPNAEEVADKVFKKKGLNRLRTINDSMRVGALILVKDGKAWYADNMLDYHDSNTSPTIATVESNSVISDFGTDSNMNASAAVDFLNSFLPVDVSGKIQFTSAAKLNQIAAKTTRIKVPNLKAFLLSPMSKTFRDEMTSFVNDGYKVYLGYEVYQSNRIKLVSSTGSDISGGANIGEIKPLVEGVHPQFSWVKNSDLSLDVNGDNFYTFAVRTLKLKWENGQWKIQLGNFSEGGVLGAAAADQRYSFSPLKDNQTDFSMLEFESGKPPRSK